MSREREMSFIANSLANLLVGAASLGYAVIVPAAVLRRFGADLYGTWYLAFQIAAYILLLDLGSQYLVSKEAAIPAADHRAARLATAAMLSQSALAMTVLCAATAWARLTGQATLARLVVILGIAAIGSLLASTVRAWFGGLRRAHVPALWLVSARGAALAGLGFALAAHSDLVTVTMAVAVPQLMVYAGLLLWTRRAPSPWSPPDRAAFVRLIGGSSPLALWTVAGILIGGVDIFIVRALDPSEVARYAIALPLLAIPIGMATAGITAWMPLVARAEAAGPTGGLGATLKGTTVMAAALAMGAIPFIGYADEVVRLWAGAGPWDSAVGYLQVLYLASCLRFMFLPWSILIVVRGQQGLITLVPLTEAAVNVAASVVLGLWLGAVGVALGTLVGAAAASALYLGWAVPRTARSEIIPADLVQAVGAALPPLAAATGIAVLALTNAPAIWRTVATLVAVGINLWWVLSRRRKPMVPAALETSS